jgi:hypothetical protein
VIITLVLYVSQHENFNEQVQNCHHQTSIIMPWSFYVKF